MIQKIVEEVKHVLSDAEGGHDWYHIERVWKTSLVIAKDEEVNLQVVELAALLHDIADSKFHNGDETIGPKLAKEIMSKFDIEASIAEHVIKIIENISYKGGYKSSDFESLELDIVRDADRLDAIGAIGIARAFNYGGFKNRAIYDPSIEPNLRLTKEEYKKGEAPTINHFYEKLLLLKELMKTKTGKAIAEERHQFMLDFLDQFYSEVRTNN